MYYSNPNIPAELSFLPANLTVDAVVQMLSESEADQTPLFMGNMENRKNKSQTLSDCEVGVRGFEKLLVAMFFTKWRSPPTPESIKNRENQTGNEEKRDIKEGGKE